MKLKKLTLTSMLIAFTVVMGLVVKIPVGREMFTLANVVVFISAFLLGKKQGLIIGSLSGLLIDGIAGFWIWAPVTLLVYGLMGFVAGYFGEQKKSNISRIIGMILCWLILVGGYFVGGAIIFGSFAVATAGIPVNVMQGGLGFVIALAIYPVLKPVLGKRVHHM
ncbi:MAG: ECF transporter S component [Streptococcaceae bacterium]|jgi:uncharacterized membrane protein|nr:ECF transporter S component [Streptococcaceae bacterium]